MRLNIRIAGSGGQGVILTSVLLAKAYGIGENLNISQTQSYGPEARGGACKAEVVISDEKIDYMKVDEADVFIAYNQAGYDKYSENVKEKALTLINSTLVEIPQILKEENELIYLIPATDMAESMGKAQVVNMIMLGALTKLLPKLHYNVVIEEIKNNFSSKLVNINFDAFDKGYKYLEEVVKEQKVGDDNKLFSPEELNLRIEKAIQKERALIAQRLAKKGVSHKIIGETTLLTPKGMKEIVATSEFLNMYMDDVAKRRI